MEAVGFIVGLAIAGLVVGALARLAVPGPDPMPIWLTIVVGIVGSFVGGVLGGLLAALAGYEPTDEAGGIVFGLLAAVIGATLVVILYRKVIQKRPVTGPDAHVRPERSE